MILLKLYPRKPVTNPSKTMDTAHRKIELQSPADFAYLQSNALRAARQKIDLHLPSSAAPAGEDALRRRVEELVDEVGLHTEVELLGIR